MKNLFRINRTDSELSNKPDPTPFDAAHITPELEAELDSVTGDALTGGEPETNPVPRPGWKLWVGLGLLIPVVAAVLIAGDALFDESRAWLAWAALGVMVVSAVLITMARVEQSRRMKESVHSSTEYDLKAGMEKLGRLSDEARRQLSIPDDALELDIFPFVYRKKGDAERSVYGKGRFDNIPLLAWRRGKCLCLSDSRVVLSVPTDAILGRYTVDEVFEVDMWLKECGCSEGRYKQFGLKKSGLMGARGRGWDAVQLRDAAGDSYELLVPCYDVCQLEKLVDIPVLQ